MTEWDCPGCGCLRILHDLTACPACGAARPALVLVGEHRPEPVDVPAGKPAKVKAAPPATIAPAEDGGDLL